MLTCCICGISSDKTKIIKTKKLDKADRLLCRRHYDQTLKHGKIIKEFKNKFIEKDDYYEMIVFSDKGKYICEISKEDYKNVSNHEWWIINNGFTNYVTTKINGKQILLHRFIVKEIDENKTVDHIDRNGLNNKRCNLRVVSNTMQNINQKIRKDNTSGVKGVGFHKMSGKWRVRIQYKNVSKSCLCDSFEEAVETRRKWEKERDKLL